MDDGALNIVIADELQELLARLLPELGYSEADTSRVRDMVWDAAGGEPPGPYSRNARGVLAWLTQKGLVR